MRRTKLTDFKLKEGNHFIAMEYYNLFLNRTFLVLILEDDIIGLKVNGMVSIEANGNDILSRYIANNWVVRDDLNDPFSYIKNSYIEKIANLNIYGEAILKAEKPNFKISHDDIKDVIYDKRKKWGMGYYPHDGKVYIKTKSGKKKELIILGSQSGKEIQSWLT